MKKLLLSFGALGIAIATLPLVAAFEAHVINVTARIENALSVTTDAIDFGTVFPQEELDAPIEVALSQSFLDEDRVDDVQYFIRQKPKCAYTWNDGENADLENTATGHIVFGNNPATEEIEEYWIDCGEAPREPREDADPEQEGTQVEVWGQLPLLCPYLSKHKGADGVEPNETELDAFHTPFTVNTSTQSISWTDTFGYLTKAGQDIVDNWLIDLKVPCFGNYCAQDWESFVAGINDNADPDDYTQPIENEHKIFGCDLWIEVGGVSTTTGGFGCEEQGEVMLVLDRSGSINSNELDTMKSAATDFVNLVGPSTVGAHMGMVSFSDSASLDVHLTDSAATVNAAINALTAGGLTNLEGALLDATAELANPGDGHDRAEPGSPDDLVLITDGAPTTSDTGGDHSANAIAAATAAKAAGIEIWVVGVGTDAGTSQYLRDNIASGSDHYFDASDFSDLSDILDGIGQCEEPQPGPKVGALLSAYSQPTGENCNVTVDDTGGNPSLDTIAEGIATATAGQTVCVADGTYNESVTIDKDITLAGDGATATSVINGNVTIGADGATLEGFEINGTVASNFHGVTIRYNKVTAASSNSAIGFGGTSGAGSTVMHNVVSNPGNRGIYLDQNGTTAFMVTYNTVSARKNGFGSQSSGTAQYNVFSGYNMANGVGFEVVNDIGDTVVISINNFNEAGITGLAVENDGALTFDAPDNWWGAADPTGHHDAEVTASSPEAAAYPQN